MAEIMVVMRHLFGLWRFGLWWASPRKRFAHPGLYLSFSAGDEPGVAHADDWQTRILPWPLVIRAGLRWYDCWVGCYICVPEQAIYVCPLPCVMIRIELV